ncbi:L-threonylcarbamoyladenylate synthase [Marinobacter sp.]|uniref:L-threonylcarbamoyladenylate synthase n=1 Tax=Marinobacter sp. TaxID=50741 RepID=UPI00384AB79E
MTNDFSPLSQWQLDRARRTVHRGGVIAYPTEGVWGLGCDPWNPDAVEEILELKQRPAHKGLILVAASTDQIEFLLAPLDPEMRERATRHWPGPVTCLLPDPEDRVPFLVKGDHSAIAVRVSDHPVVKALCEAAGQPLVSTSCNPAGRPPARHGWQVRRYFGQGQVHIVPGALGGNRKPSRILDIVTGQWLR